LTLIENKIRDKNPKFVGRSLAEVAWIVFLALVSTVEILTINFNYILTSTVKIKGRMQNLLVDLLAKGFDSLEIGIF